MSPASPRPLHPWEWRVVGLLIVCFLCRGLPWRLDEFDQAKQAYVSLEIVKAGHWWFQHLPGSEFVATKPPLVGWVSAGLYYLTGGNWEMAWRLPSLLAGFALAWLLWQAGERAWPGRGGLVAMAAFAFNLPAPRLASLVRTDMPLTLWITAIGLIVRHHARPGGPPWSPRARWAVFGLLLAAMMTKGPVVYAFLLPGMLAHAWVGRRRGVPVPLWGGWWHWTLPVLPFLVWTLAGIETVPGFYAQVVGREFLGRFTVGEHAEHRNQPVYFYLAHLAKDWLPWDVLLLAVTIRRRQLWAALCREPDTLWLICWAAGGFVLLSLVPSKRPDRIFPVVPPLALLLTALLARAQNDRPAAPGPTAPLAPAVPPRWPWDWTRLAMAAAVALGLGATLAGIAQVYRHHVNARASFAATVRQTQSGKEIALVVPPNQSEAGRTGGRNDAGHSKRATDGLDAEQTDETMLVYLRQTAFLSPAEAIQRWSTGKLDAVVINADARGQIAGLLEPFAPTQPALESVGSTPPYLLLTRHTAPAAPPKVR